MTQNSLLTWLRLVRLPAVFTALADIFAGYLLTHTSWEPAPRFLALVGASAGLYLSGMVFNDIFDVAQDRQERPSRPIPSGAVSLQGAALLASFLMIAGLSLCALAGRNSLLIGIALAGAILAYDGLLKKTLLGPVVMGLCRFLNILLGASTASVNIAEIWGQPQLWVAASMWLYITGVTWFARSEAKISHRLPLFTGLILINFGLIMLGCWIMGVPEKLGLDMGPVGTVDTTAPMILWGAITFSLNRRLFSAIADPRPAFVQPAIGILLLSIITIDAMVIFYRLGHSAAIYMITTLALIIPAVLLRRWISMT